MQEIQKELAGQNLGPLERGKGANVWYAMGYFLASGRGVVLGMHDADIVTYSRDMLAKLIYPVANPTFGYVFSKGFYFRTDPDGFNGRVSRLLVTPLIRALQQTLGQDGATTGYNGVCFGITPATNGAYCHIYVGDGSTAGLIGEN